MADVDFKLNLPGLNELMKSPEMKSILADAAGKIAATANATANANASPNIKTANEGYEAKMPIDLRFISLAEVRAVNFGARLDNSRHNTLRKAMDSVKI